MIYVIDVSMDDAEESFELAGLPFVPSPGDTVEVAGKDGRIVGIVSERHFTYAPPDKCRVALACKRL